MLVLTRKTGQSIFINSPRLGEIEVVLVEVRGDESSGGSPQVRLGVAAPKDVTVHRKEVYLQIQEENEAASKTSADVKTPAHVPGSTVGLTLEEIRRREKAKGQGS